MMGQWTVKEAGSAVRRIILVLAVAAVMVAVSAMPAMAENIKGPDGKRPLASGDVLVPLHNGASAFPCTTDLCIDI
jgi:hypothetical protein